jgi:hypothetical protein
MLDQLLANNTTDGGTRAPLGCVNDSDDEFDCLQTSHP